MQMNDLLAAYSLAFSQATPKGTPRQEGAEALIELLACLIVAEPSPLIDDVLELCAHKLGERVAFKIWLKGKLH